MKKLCYQNLRTTFILSIIFVSWKNYIINFKGKIEIMQIYKS